MRRARARHPRRTWPALGLALALAASQAAAQELEPRALINAPIGVNFLIAAAGYAYGNVLIDPSLPLDDFRARVGSLALGYQRIVDVFGMVGRIGAVVPTASGRWEATLSGIDTATNRTGFGDPTVKFAVNFVGSPALTMSEFRDYRQATVVGAQVAVTAPLGQYDPDRLVNLGTNRWTIAPRLGASQVFGRRWVLEGYASVSFYTANAEYFGGGRLTQAPFFDTQAHLIYAIRGTDFWAAASVGYGWGGRTTADGVPGDAITNVRLSGVLRYPLARGHSLKLAYINGFRTEVGADYDTIQLVYTHAWGGKP